MSMLPQNAACKIIANLGNVSAPIPTPADPGKRSEFEKWQDANDEKPQSSYYYSPGKWTDYLIRCELRLQGWMARGDLESKPATSAPLT